MCTSSNRQHERDYLALFYELLSSRWKASAVGVRDIIFLPTEPMGKAMRCDPHGGKHKCYGSNGVAPKISGEIFYGAYDLGETSKGTA